MALLLQNAEGSLLSHTMPSLILLGVICVGLFLLGTCVYNLFFHPLRHYPGPLLARSSRLWYIWSFTSGRFHLETQKAHEKYGDVVRIAPDELSYTAAPAWKDIYGTRAGKPEMPKDPVFYSGILSTGSLVTAPRDRHGFMRRLLAHSFSASALREQETLVESYADLLIFKLTEACGNGATPLNMAAWFNYFSFDIIGDLAFGETFGCLKTNGYHPWVENLVAGVKGGLIATIGTRYPLFNGVINKILVPQAMIEKKKFHNQMTKERLEKRLQQSTDRTDFLVKMVEPGSGVTDAELLANVSLLTAAGSETTASLLSASTYLLLLNPSKYAKLMEELKVAFQSGNPITCESTRELPYLGACLEEALRMIPPLPSSLPRRTPSGSDFIHGGWVPEETERTTVSMSLWPTFRSPKNFRDPDDFVPERWLGDERYKKDDHTAFHPFSTGSRNCLGMNLAYSEARLALAKVIWHFDLQLMDESKDWVDHLESFFIWYKVPLMMQLKPGTRAQ